MKEIERQSELATDCAPAPERQAKNALESLKPLMI
jgi:hypothetical protein